MLLFNSLVKQTCSSLWKIRSKGIILNTLGNRHNVTKCKNSNHVKNKPVAEYLIIANHIYERPIKIIRFTF